MCSHSPAYTQCQILCCYTCGSVSAGATYPCRATLWHVVTEGTCEFRYSLQFIFAGPVYHNVLTNRAALLSPRGPSLCPSGNSPCAALCVDLTTCVAEQYLTLRTDCEKHGSKNPLPFSVSERSHVGNLRQANKQGKDRSSKRKGNRRYPFLFAPAAGAAISRAPQSATPRRISAKNFPSVRDEHACAVRVPRSAGAEKCCPDRANRLRGSCIPAGRCRNSLRCG